MKEITYQGEEESSMNDKLDRTVLVLNKCFNPTYLTTVKDSLILLISEKAVILDESYQHYNFEDWLIYSEEEPESNLVHTPTMKIKIPSVIRLLDYEDVQSHLISFSRENLYARDGYKCQYCGKAFSRKELTIDHIIPKSRKTDFNMTMEEIRAWTNITTACAKCNMKKGNKTPEEAYMPLLSQPKKPKWTNQVRGLNYKSDIDPVWKIFLKQDLKKEEN